MANIALQKTPGPIASLLATREPFKLLENLLHWDPFGEMGEVVRTQPGIFAPAFEVKETKEAYEFRADLPGVREKDIEVTIIANRLTIRGMREQETVDDNDRFYAAERCYGTFTRTFTLPEGIDEEHVRGALKEGVLTVVAPKAMELKAKKVVLDVPKSKA